MFSRLFRQSLQRRTDGYQLPPPQNCRRENSSGLVKTGHTVADDQVLYAHRVTIYHVIVL